MPTEYAELEADTFVYADDWKELLDPAGEDSITNGAMEATLTGIVPFNKIRSCARHFLGYSYAFTGIEDYGLYREPPAAHPRWGNLYAHGVSFRPYVPQANTDNSPVAYPYILSPFDENLRTGNFEKVIVTVRFRSYGRMRFLPDDDIGDYQDEWKRWVQWTTAPAIEALSADGASQLLFAEGGPPPLGNAFPAPIAVLLAKTTFVMTWMHVPHNYVSSDPDILIPTNILDCVGRTNSVDFLGFETGTLLMQPPSFEPVLFPVVAADNYDLITGWNIHIPFQFFDPPKGVPGSSYRGHNLMPERTTGKFFLATRNGATSGPKLLPEADFIDLFKHIEEP